MVTPVPKNVAAAIGLVPTVLDGVRRLPGKAVQLPVMAVGHALAGLDAAKREYDDLADRGEKVIARLRGGSLVKLETTVEDALEGVGRTAARAVGNVNGSSTVNAMDAVKAGAAHARDRAEAEASVETALAVAAKAAGKTVREPSPEANGAPVAPAGRVDSAATSEVIAQVEKIARNVAAPAITDHSDLPLPDYDHMTLGSLRGRLRSLDMQQLVQLRDYERSKADRLPVVTMLDNRIAKLANGESRPSGGSEPAAVPPVTKPPKSVGAAPSPAATRPGNTPPHSKVRLT